MREVLGTLGGWKDRTRATKSCGGIAKGVRNEVVLLTFTR
jgi:hypothetical protein